MVELELVALVSELELLVRVVDEDGPELEADVEDEADVDVGDVVVVVVELVLELVDHFDAVDDLLVAVLARMNVEVVPHEQLPVQARLEDL